MKEICQQGSKWLCPKDDFGGQDIEVDEFIWPPAPFEYNPNSYENDIIILKLKTPLVLNEIVHPTALPPSLTFAENFSNENCILSGWGRLNSSKFNTILTIQTRRQNIYILATASLLSNSHNSSS